MQKKMNLLAHLLGLSGVLLLLTGCEITPEEPEARLSMMEEKQLVTHLEDSCPAYLAAYSDQRSTTTISTLDADITKEQVSEWILTSLSEANFALKPVTDGGSLNMILEKSFLQNYANSVIANIVLSVQYKPGDSAKFPEYREFKGMAVAANDSLEAAELESLFKQAIDRAINRVNRAYRYGCAQQALQAGNTAGFTETRSIL